MHDCYFSAQASRAACSLCAQRRAAPCNREGGGPLEEAVQRNAVGGGPLGRWLWPGLVPARRLAFQLLERLPLGRARWLEAGDKGTLLDLHVDKRVRRKVPRGKLAGAADKVLLRAIAVATLEACSPVAVTLQEQH